MDKMFGRGTMHIDLFSDPLKPMRFKQQTFTIVLSTLAINILSLSLPIMTLQVYDRILPNPGTGTLPILITGICIAVLLETILQLSRSYIINRSGASYEHLIACRALKKILGANLSSMQNYGIGEYLQKMGSVSKLKDFYNGYALTVYTEIIFVPIFFGLILYISGPLAVVPAIIIILFIITSLVKGRSLLKSLEDREKEDDKRFNFLIESLEGIHTLKAMTLEKLFSRKYEALEDRSTLANFKVTQNMAGIFNSGAIFSQIMVASIITAGAWCVLNGFLTTGGLIAVLLLSGRLMQPIQKALALWARYQAYILARKHVEDILQTPQHRKDQSYEDTSDIYKSGDLGLENISFSFDKYGPDLLENININLEGGHTIHISGTHGSGKSTLLSLIAGIYPPLSGEIFVDGQNIHDFDPGDLSNHIGYIKTSPVIFRGTIRDNITCFGQISEPNAREIASLLKVDEDIAKLPNGFDTFLKGDDTDSIPPGLKQRISIVRALAPKPRIILFDNADVSLDRQGYAMTYSLLARLKGKASMVLISDDLNIKNLADTFYVLTDQTLKQIQGNNAPSGNVKPYRELNL